jgi:UDP-N-acetylmuramoyl-tripeptide--D-alanyl-D-alanine ligase
MKRLHDVLPPARRGLWRETAAELAAEAAALVAPGDVVMVKGSNGSKASLVAKALAALGGRECALGCFICCISTTPTSRRTIRC